MSVPMIVYGDPSYNESLGALWERLRTRLTALDSDTYSLDALRGLLIQAGQLEQAAEDGLPSRTPEGRPLMARCRTITDFAATAFLRRWAEPDAYVADLLTAMGRVLQTAPPSELCVTVKLPEGFAFYALFPEQYADAARRWLADHTGTSSRRAIVVGVRSIGTTLSALVTAVLAAGGWEARRLTVRPSGHPFQREVELGPGELGGAEWGLVVDEGPGLSGSSMAAAAEALQRAGLARERISFFPGHNGEPGRAASESVRAWWAAVPRYVTSPDALRWDGRSLPERLADLTPALLGIQEPVERMEDFGGGLWRRAVFPSLAVWPAVAAPFERPKYRCVLRGGEAVLWKFAGLAALPDGPGNAAETLYGELAARSAAEWAPMPLGVACGFVATPWITGEPLTRADGSPALLDHVGRYIAAAVGPALSSAEQEAAWERLNHLLYWNTREALGDAAAGRVRRWNEAARRWVREAAPPTYGDGSLAPHEWIRTEEGQVVKTDSCGHDWDHTVVGRQAFAWDVAGAMVEWGCDSATSVPLMDALRSAGLDVLPGALTFYRLAYAAFRMGICSLCAAACPHDPDEQARLRRAADGYRATIVRRLDGGA